jgi:peptide deformylase
LVLINPEIIASNGEIEYQEGCLSVPGAYDTVIRAETVTLRALDRFGKPYEMTASGLLGECFQHEIDHMNGKLFVDLLSPLKRSIARRKLDKYLRDRPHK